MAEAQSATIEQEEEYAAQLNEQIRIEEEAEQSRISTLDIAQRVAMKLNRLIEEGHATGAFMFITMLAIFKDVVMDNVLDLIIIGEIPIIGQIPGMMISGTIWFFVRMRTGYVKRKYRHLLLWTIDCMPFFINNLPITTISILWMWHDARKAAAQAEENAKDLKNKTEEQLRKIDKTEDWELQTI